MAVTEGNISVQTFDVYFDSNDLGATSGGITVTPSVNLVDITADQLGGQIIDQVISGVDVEVSMTLIELNGTMWDRLVSDQTGDDFTPTSGTKLVGYGTARNFKNMSANAKELKLKPTGASNDEKNLTFWKAYPVPGSFSYSADSPNAVEVTFRCIRDTTKNENVSLFAYGDGTQSHS